MSDLPETNTAEAPASDPTADAIALMAAGIGTLSETVSALATRQAETEERVSADIDKRLTTIAGETRTTRRPEGETQREPRIEVPDRFRTYGYGDPSPAEVAWGQRAGMTAAELRETVMRSNLEVAMLVLGGTQDRKGIGEVAIPDDLQTAFRTHAFEGVGPRPFVTDGEGRKVRAMDSAESGFGLELIGVQYVTNMWEAARNLDSIVSDIRTVPMTAPTMTIPIDGDMPEMLFVGESTTSSATAYTTSKTGSGNRDLTAKKFTIQQIWSGELGEDSVVPWIPFLRDQLNMAAASYLGSAYLNGDTTNAGTGNINLDDADPADTKHYLAWDGIRHYWLVDATGQGKDMAAALDDAEITVARGKLNGGDDDIDNLIKNINWGLNPRDLRLVCDWDTYIQLTQLDSVKTIDKYGPQATIVTGELGSIHGIPIISPSYASKTMADGKASTTEASNTKGQITIFAPRGYIGGVRREMQLFFDRIQRTDQFLFELYTRRGFNRHGANVAAGIYNITV
jgi:HK97 family phage major capsid protein